MAIDAELSPVPVTGEEREIALAEAARLGSVEPVLEWARQAGQEAARKDAGVEGLTASLVKAGADLAQRLGEADRTHEQVIEAGIGAYLVACEARKEDAALNLE